MDKEMIRYCQICREERNNNYVICDNPACSAKRDKLIEILRKYTPTRGCENCLADLHQGCSDQCKAEFRLAGELSRDLWELIRIK